MKKLYQYLLKIIMVFLRMYWKIFAPSSVGVKALVKREDGKILLVHHSYKPKWYLPGGGLKKYENASQGAKREILEETAIDLDEVKFLGVYRAVEDFKNDWIFAFYGQVDNDVVVKIDEIEIIEYKWIDATELDSVLINKRDKRIIKEFISNGTSYHFDI